MPGASPDYTFGPTAVLTPANLITFARVAALPLVIYLILTAEGPTRWWTLGLWSAVMTSDLLDGFLARKQGATTSGAYLDPLADKFAVLGSLAALAYSGRVSWIPFGIIAIREMAVSLFRSYASRRAVTIPATPFGKAKTLSQAIAIGVLLLPPADDFPIIEQVAIWVAVGFTVASGLDYLRRGSTYLASDTKSGQPPVDEGTIESAIRLGRVVCSQPDDAVKQFTKGKSTSHRIALVREFDETNAIDSDVPPSASQA